MKSIVINSILSVVLFLGVVVFWFCSICSETFNPFTKTVEFTRVIEKSTINGCNQTVGTIIWEGKVGEDWLRFDDRFDLGNNNSVYDSFYTINEIESGKVNRVRVGRVVLFIMFFAFSLSYVIIMSASDKEYFYNYTNTKFTKDIKFLSTTLIFFGYDESIIERTVNTLLERNKNQTYLIGSVNDIEKMFWEEYEKQKDIT